jgi:hypothetical protein
VGDGQCVVIQTGRYTRYRIVITVPDFYAGKINGTYILIELHGHIRIQSHAIAAVSGGFVLGNRCGKNGGEAAGIRPVTEAA